MKKKTVFERHPKRVLLVTISIFLVLILSVTEIILRSSGFLPEKSFYKTTDTLVVLDNFYTDHEGVFKANPESKEWGKHTKINSEGFRGEEFTPSPPGKQSILFLGDSFTWGANAEPITNSYADLLNKAGYHVYNLGIPGTSPTQYQYLANQYIPKLRPDYVIVSFYLGNDLKEKPDPMIPDKNLYHVTNAGWFRGFSREGQPLSAEESYSHYLGKINHRRIVKGLVSTSVGTALLYSVRDARKKFKRAFTKKAPSNEIKNKTPINKTPLIDKYRYTFQTLQRIFSLSKSAGSQPFLLVIPEYGKRCCRNNEHKAKHYQPILEKLNPIYLDDMPQTDFRDAPDCHINNDGHTFVAERILSVIRNQ